MNKLHLKNVSLIFGVPPVYGIAPDMFDAGARRGKVEDPLHSPGMFTGAAHDLLRIQRVTMLRCLDSFRYVCPIKPTLENKTDALNIRTRAKGTLQRNS